MKVIFILFFLFFSMADTALAREYKARKKTQDYVIEMSIDRNPPIVAKNTLTIEVKDNAGKYITDAKVLVN
ncbi:MAG: hypothetical protein AB1442_15060, partial [Nitrospirota bacterium]